ncbi:hypothetical protein [Streptomyces sp. FH025]|uniref:hypothetical protein n=1 Tax=Streptomyces sp. FH025 TaxID=2815937 RepID=UPI001A9EE47D|nr:hypothetical protein [Streptomyces sp. FH025]MBO1413443.1 hypothetical protein [Streptomyces sp. FH025]
MQQQTKRAIATGVAAVVSTATGLIINVVTDNGSLAWWVALGAFVVLGAVLQVLIGRWESDSGTVSASGPGSVAVGGSSHGAIRTKVRGTTAPPPGGGGSGTSGTFGTSGTNAGGAGAVVVQGDAHAPIETDVEH